MRYTDCAVVANPGQSVTGWRETDTVHPAPTFFMFQQHLSKGHFGSPGCGSRSVLNVLNICRKYSRMTTRYLLQVMLLFYKMILIVALSKTHSIDGLHIQTCNGDQQNQLPAAYCWDASLDSKLSS